jgi:hypothetical protein
MPVVFRGSFLNPTWRDAMKTWEAKMPGPLLTHRRQISELVWIPAGGLSADDHKHWDCLKIRTIKIPSFIYNVWYILYMYIHVYLYHLFEWSSSHENYHLAVSRQTQIGFDLIPHDLRELTNLEDVSKQPVWRFSIQSIRICACTGFSDFCWEWNDFPWLITMFPICFPYVSHMFPIWFPYVSHMFPTKHSHFLTWDCHDRPALRAKKVLVTWGRLEHHHLESIHLVIGSLKNRSLLGVHIYSMHIYIYNIIIYTYDII